MFVHLDSPFPPFERANGLRYRQVGGTRGIGFGGICLNTESTPFGEANPTYRVHAMLARNEL